MLTLSLLPVANQNFQSFLNDQTWDITVQVHESGAAFVSVKIDGQDWVNSLRMTSNLPVFFNDRLAQYGQLVLFCPEGQALDFLSFGVTQFLIYADEL